jgi:hypothetical protein
LNPIPLGSENGVLPDTSFTASSFATSREPFKARLRGQFGNLVRFLISRNIFKQIKLKFSFYKKKHGDPERWTSMNI